MSAKIDYPDYKDSGVEWLGKIPSHWQIARIRNSVQSAKNGVWGDDPNGGDEDIRCVRVADFNRQQMTIHDESVTFRSVPSKDRIGRVLRKGDLLLEKSGGGPNTPVGFVVLYDKHEPAVCSNFVARVELRTGQDSSYWRYLHATTYASGLTQRSIKQATGIQNLDQSSYFDEAAPFPPFEEQRAIASYLDHETAEIDAFIADQEELIALLKERRAATITQAVTKGLDLTVQMKVSGIEWLGKTMIPVGWEARKLGHVARMRSGDSITAETIETEGTYPVYGGGGFRGYTESFTNEGRHVLIGRQGALCGNIKIADGKFFATEHAVVTYPRASADIIWFASILEVMNLGQYSQSAAQPGISVEVIAQKKMPLPPYEEQVNIGKFIDREAAEIDAAIADAKEAIELSKERRAALISAVVTGKIDVRNHISAELGAA